jgi:hypothetical protein
MFRTLENVSLIFAAMLRAQHKKPRHRCAGALKEPSHN